MDKISQGWVGMHIGRDQSVKPKQETSRGLRFNGYWQEDIGNYNFCVSTCPIRRVPEDVDFPWGGLMGY